MKTGTKAFIKTFIRGLADYWRAEYGGDKSRARDVLNTLRKTNDKSPEILTHIKGEPLTVEYAKVIQRKTRPRK